jgi:hypothetical protein
MTLFISQKLRIVNLISFLTLFVVFLMVLVIGYWELYPYNPIEFKNVPFQILNENKIVKQGDRARYLVSSCKNTKEVPIVTKKFIDGVIYETTSQPGVIPLGCQNTIMDVYVPKAIPTGTYKVQIIAQFKVNPIRTITVISNTESFNVVK